MYSRDIEYILAIYEHGSITKAADKLFLTQPALSRYLIALENRLDVQIFDRSTSPMSLTQYGHAYVEVALKMRNLQRDLEARQMDLKALRSGLVKLGIPTIRGEFYLPVLLPAFKSRYPNIDFEIEVGSSYYLEECVLKGKIDFIIVNSPLQIDAKALEVRTITTEFLSIATPPAMLPEKNNPYTFKHLQKCLDLNNQNYILLQPEQRLRQLADMVLAKYNIVPKSILTVGSFSIVENLVASGMGLTISNRVAQRKSLYHSIPDEYSLGDDYILNAIVAWRKGAYLSLAAKEFIKLIFQKFGMGKVSF